MKKLLSLVAVAATLTCWVAEAAAGNWYILLESIPASADRMEGDFHRVGALAKPCRLKWFNDFSDKFVGFRPGYNVFVVGPLASERDALNTASRARKCFPGAYAKQGRYLGE